MKKDALCAHSDMVDALALQEEVEMEFPEANTRTIEVTAGRCATKVRDLHRQLKDELEEIGMLADTYRMAENLMWLANMDCVGDEGTEFTVKVRTDKPYPLVAEITDRMIYILAPQLDRGDSA